MQMIAVGPRQFPEIHSLGEACARRLGIGIPQIFVFPSPDLNAYTYATDDEALEGVKILSELEGIIPALESAHAVAEVVKRAPKMPKDSLIIVNLSGRGDKDLDVIMREIKLRETTN